VREHVYGYQSHKKIHCSSSLDESLVHKGIEVMKQLPEFWSATSIMWKDWNNDKLRLQIDIAKGCKMKCAIDIIIIKVGSLNIDVKAEMEWIYMSRNRKIRNWRIRTTMNTQNRRHNTMRIQHICQLRMVQKKKDLINRDMLNNEKSIFCSVCTDITSWTHYFVFSWSQSQYSRTISTTALAFNVIATSVTKRTIVSEWDFMFIKPTIDASDAKLIERLEQERTMLVEFDSYHLWSWQMDKILTDYSDWYDSSIND
jgi:hypothetical protein